MIKPMKRFLIDTEGRTCLRIFSDIFILKFEENMLWVTTRRTKQVSYQILPIIDGNIGYYDELNNMTFSTVWMGNTYDFLHKFYNGEPEYSFVSNIPEIILDDFSTAWGRFPGTIKVDFKPLQPSYGESLDKLIIDFLTDFFKDV